MTQDGRGRTPLLMLGSGGLSLSRLWQPLNLSNCDCPALISKGETAQLRHIFKLFHTYELLNLDPCHGKCVPLDKLDLHSKTALSASSNTALCKCRSGECCSRQCGQALLVSRSKRPYDNLHDIWQHSQQAATAKTAFRTRGTKKTTLVWRCWSHEG